MLLSRNVTSSPPFIPCEDDTEGIPLDMRVRVDPATSLKPVSFHTDPLSPAIDTAAPASVDNSSTSNMYNRQVLSVQYNTMPAPGLSDATHQTPTRASNTIFVSSSFSNATGHSCTPMPTVLTCPVMRSWVTNPAPFMTAWHPTKRLS